MTTQKKICVFFIILLVVSPSITAISTNHINTHSNKIISPISEKLNWDMQDGVGLIFTLTNTFNHTLSNLSIQVIKQNGLLTFLPQINHTISTLPSGQSHELSISIFGLGLGILSILPSIAITVEAQGLTPLQITIDIALFGFLTKIKNLFTNENESYPGYILFAPTTSTRTYLINNSGAVVKTWESSHLPAKSVYLLENGNILRAAYPGPHPLFIAGGVGGKIESINPNGTIIWDFNYNTNSYCLHHDIQPLPNGNILMIAWELNTYIEAIQAGRNPAYLPVGGLWSDHIIEVKPTSPSTGEIVWEWHVWDHLIQDYDPSKDNYGVIEDHPELININNAGERVSDWNHINSIDYHKTYDQILLSVNAFNEIWVIDHSTTIEEAADHTGGRYGKGGDLLYRWGNPQTYNHGQQTDQKFFNQHDARWIPEGSPGQGNILIFNNGVNRPTFDYSSVEELEPPIDQNGNYSYVTGLPYGPAEPKWIYTAPDPTDLFALIVSGAQRLPNGNTLICDGPQGRFFEVTQNKNIVWEYSNPYPDPTLFNRVFKIHRYSEEYPGIQKII